MNSQTSSKTTPQEKKSEALAEKQGQAEERSTAVKIKEGGNGKRGMTKKEGETSAHWRGPMTLMRQFADDMDRLFDSFSFRPLPLRSRWHSDAPELWSPQIDVFQRGDEFVVRADLPGMTKDDIQLDLTENALTLQGERSEEHEQTEENYYHAERSCGTFFRSIPLPEGVDAQSISANFKDGVLEVTMKAPESSQSRRRIEIEGK